jgi:hypothetical protein
METFSRLKGDLVLFATSISSSKPTSINFPGIKETIGGSKQTIELQSEKSDVLLCNIACTSPQ